MKILHEIDCTDLCMKTETIPTSYNDMVFSSGDYYKKSLLKIYTSLCADREEYDYIAFTGQSGAMIAYGILSQEYCTAPLPFLLVRKGESTHGHMLETALFCSSPKNDELRIAVVDDFIATGATMVRILDTIKKELKRTDIVLTSAYLLHSDCYKVDIRKYNDIKEVYKDDVE